jgi:hypothetical protein
VDSAFLKEQVMRCRTLAEKADQFTKRRLLDLADKYEVRLGRPSHLAERTSLPEERTQRPPATGA